MLCTLEMEKCLGLRKDNEKVSEPSIGGGF
jgi:hypothetical protein